MKAAPAYEYRVFMFSNPRLRKVSFSLQGWNLVLTGFEAQGEQWHLHLCLHDDRYTAFLDFCQGSNLLHCGVSKAFYIPWTILLKLSLDRCPDRKSSFLLVYKITNREWKLKVFVERPPAIDVCHVRAEISRLYKLKCQHWVNSVSKIVFRLSALFKKRRLATQDNFH